MKWRQRRRRAWKQRMISVLLDAYWHHEISAQDTAVLLRRIERA